MTIVDRIRATPPHIVLTDVGFDFCSWGRSIHYLIDRSQQPVTREMVEAFLADPWGHISPHELAHAYLSLLDEHERLKQQLARSEARIALAELEPVGRFPA